MELFLLFFALTTTREVDSAWSVNNMIVSRPSTGNLSLVRSPETTFPSYLLVADSISKGIEVGLSECQHQFRWDRWDCSDRGIMQVVHSSKLEVNRETAVVQALVTSGVMHVIMLNCSTGTLDSCTCDTYDGELKTGQQWSWRGCKDAGARYGDHLTRVLFDEIIEGEDARAVVNLHNNQVGRTAIWRTMQVRCKCHGVSGSCSLRTCWHRLPDFRSVGHFLRRRYDRAVHTDFQDGELRHGNDARRHGPALISSKDLVYLLPSPDYCSTPRARGGQGASTEGRECSRPGPGVKASRSERRSCRTLCTDCGLKVRRYLVEVVARCHCRFYWCCTVRCKECTEVVDKYYCQR